MVDLLRGHEAVVSPHARLGAVLRDRGRAGDAVPRAAARIRGDRGPSLDEVAWEFFGTESAKSAFRAKVTALYPKHEIEQFTELFWNRVQAWRAEQK